jgi:hypothetical protein
LRPGGCEWIKAWRLPACGRDKEGKRINKKREQEKEKKSKKEKRKGNRKK